MDDGTDAGWALPGENCRLAKWMAAAQVALAMPIAYQALAKARLHGCKLGLQKAWCQLLLGSGDT